MSSRALLGEVPLVFDTSAWARQREPQVAPVWRTALDGELLVACPVVSLEILAVTRDQAEFELIDGALAGLTQAPVTAGTCAAALSAARELGGSRRLPAADYLIAAAASERGYGVLHEDRHFDLIASVLNFPSVRLSDLRTA